MNDVKNKFVLVNNQIIVRRAIFHREIHENPDGGGWWYYHQEQSKLILYGSSDDFGSVTKDQVKKAKLCGTFRNITDLEIIFDERNHLDVMRILIDHLGEEEGMKCTVECDYI